MDEFSKNLRLRIIETLSLIASPDDQIEYQEAVPDVDISGEIFNQWEDWYSPEIATYCNAFNEKELAILKNFHDVYLSVCDETPQMLPPLKEFMKSNAWKRYNEAATKALGLLTSL